MKDKYNYNKKLIECIILFINSLYFHSTLLNKYGLFLQEIKEAKEKKIRGQQAEQQTLRATVDDMCLNFDNNMETLFQERLFV